MNCAGSHKTKARQSLRSINIKHHKLPRCCPSDNHWVGKYFVVVVAFNAMTNHQLLLGSGPSWTV